MNAPAVAMVKIDHQLTMRVSTDLAPRPSAQRAVGISKMAYDRMKAKNTQLICASSSPNSSEIFGAMAPMQARSR